MILVQIIVSLRCAPCFQKQGRKNDWLDPLRGPTDHNHIHHKKTENLPANTTTEENTPQNGRPGQSGMMKGSTPPMWHGSGKPPGGEVSVSGGLVKVSRGRKTTISQQGSWPCHGQPPLPPRGEALAWRRPPGAGAVRPGGPVHPGGPAAGGPRCGGRRRGRHARRRGVAPSPPAPVCRWLGSSLCWAVVLIVGLGGFSVWASPRGFSALFPQSHGGEGLAAGKMLLICLGEVSSALSDALHRPDNALLRARSAAEVHAHITQTTHACRHAQRGEVRTPGRINFAPLSSRLPEVAWCGVKKCGLASPDIIFKAIFFPKFSGA